MSRLGQMPSRFAGVASAGQRLSKSFADRSAQRRTVTPWRNWYNSKEWRDLRWSVLVADQFICRRCGTLCDPDPASRNEPNAPVADHRKPHRGDRALFFDRDNLQCLCKRCHDGAKQAEERKAGGY
ncbi:HNH endonuclease [Paracoccus onubensis]|uniref:HNH endonuclease n=1 Tax=Paracoccus onubensis TaxID=1675788 RepID=A0A418T433_9RHOB|nr:HNH endonuclease [Paracoccus onubensis]RJE87972.1 HNH endonuclease [Paracoccus onubensis]